MSTEMGKIIGGVKNGIVVTSRKPSRQALINCHMIGQELWLDELNLGEVIEVVEDGKRYMGVLPPLCG